MTKLSERQRLVLTIAVAVLITGGLLGLILKDRGEIDDTNAEIATLDGQIRGYETEIRQIKDREDLVLVYRAVEERELAVLPTKQEIANFHRDLSTFLSQAGLAFQDLPESTPIESSLAKGIFVTQTQLSCEGNAASVLKFLNMIENDERLVAVKGLKLKAGRRSRLTDGGPPVHDVDVNLESYFYNPARKDELRNKIPGEEARLQAPAIRDAIAAFQPERPDNYVLRPSESRRDPLVDPRRVRPADDPEAIAAAWEREESIVLDLEERTRELVEKLEQEDAFLDTEDLFRRDRIAQEIDADLENLTARLAQVEQMKKVEIGDLLKRLDVVHARIEDAGSGRAPRELKVTREVAESMLADAVEAFEKGEYDRVSQLATQWRMYLDGKQLDPAAVTASAGVSDVRARAEIYGEFSAMLMNVTGTIVHPHDPARSVALINGRPRRSGDSLDVGGEVEVGRISKESVVFHYRGEAIRVDRASLGTGSRDGTGENGVQTSIRQR